MKKKDENVTISIDFKGSKIKPIILSGKPEEFDEKLMDIIAEPVQIVSNLIVDLAALKKEAEKVKEAAKSNKPAKSETKKEEPVKPKIYKKNKQTEMADKYFKEEKYEYARLYYKQSFKEAKGDELDYVNNQIAICNQKLDPQPENIQNSDAGATEQPKEQLDTSDTTEHEELASDIDDEEWS